jgi:hypothetical protein
MSSSDLLLWLAMTTVAVTVIAQVGRVLQRRSERRARRRHYARAGYESRPQQLSEDDAPSMGMGPARARAVRLHAEQAAAAAAAGAGGDHANPYARGTQEYVLWIATYHLRLTELAEEREELGTVRVTTAPPDPSLSRP